ncbi:MAG: PEP-CTERM sorting domain-containing protein [Planctomycetota bacterium]|jgi:hypothetical protein
MRWFVASPIVPTLLLTFGLASSAQAAPAMFAASFIFHAGGNDISSGASSPYSTNDWTALPLGYDCQHASPYTSYGAPSSRYCTPSARQRGHPATGPTATAWGRGVAPSRSIGTGTPPKITMQQSDFGVALTSTTRGFRPTLTPLLQSFTYATFVNAAGSFFAGGGAAAPAGTGYNNRTGMGANTGTWRIVAGKNAFGGVMGLLGKYGATGKLTLMKGTVTYTYTGTSSWAMVPPVGRPYKGTVKSYSPKGMPYWWNPYSKTDMWYSPAGAVTTINAIGVGTLWTTGQVGAFAKTGAYHTSQWRTGFDNRTVGGKGSIQLVTPTLTHYLSPGFNNHTAQIGMLRIMVPEPGAVLLLAVGAGVLVLLHRVSRRR